MRLRGFQGVAETGGPTPSGVADGGGSPERRSSDFPETDEFDRVDSAGAPIHPYLLRRLEVEVGGVGSPKKSGQNPPSPDT